MLPPEFALSKGQDASLYIPFQLAGQPGVGLPLYSAIARLSPGATLEQAGADLERMLPMWGGAVSQAPSLASLEETQWSAYARPLKLDYIGDIGSVLWLFLGAAGIVLVIACANVANLFLVRSEGRQQEVRSAQPWGPAVARSPVSSYWRVWCWGSWRTGRSRPRRRRCASSHLDGSGELAALSESRWIARCSRSRWGSPSLPVSCSACFRPFAQAGWTWCPRSRRADGRQRGHRAAPCATCPRRRANSPRACPARRIGTHDPQLPALRNVDPGFSNPEEVLTFRVFIPGSDIEDHAEVVLAYEDMWRRLQAIPGVTSVGASPA